MLTGGDEHGTQVERVPQWTAVRVWCAGRRRVRQVREVPVPGSLAAPQAIPQFRHLTALRMSVAGDPGKEVMGFDHNALGSAGTGRGGIHLVPLCGSESTTRRGVRDFRILSRLVQPRPGHREHHAKPVPPALAQRAGNGSRRKDLTVTENSDVSRECGIRERTPMTGNRPEEVVPHDHHATQPTAHPPAGLWSK